MSQWPGTTRESGYSTCVRVGGYCRGMGLGGTGVGYTGYYPATSKAETLTAKRAPEALAQGWSGWSGLQRPLRPQTHPAGPVGHPCPPWSGPSPHPASWPIRARFQLNIYKVSQNREVSPKYAEKASHSPYIQNGSQKSPLEIPRFPYFLAFSPKELMGHI